MGTISAIKARNIIDNTAYVLGIELMIACQALDTREYKSSKIIEIIKSEVRKTVTFLEKDRILSEDIRNMKKLIESGIIPEIVEKHIELK